MPVSGTPSKLPGLVFREDAGDVIVDDDDVVYFAKPLLGEHPDRSRAAADAHALFANVVDDGWLAGLHNHGRTLVHGELDRFSIAQVQQRVAGDGAFLAAAAGQVANAPEREHLRAVFAGGHVADGLALRTDKIALRPEVAVGVDLHLHAAVAEDAFCDDRDHVHALDFGGDDERGGLVVGIGCAGADGGHKSLR